MNVHELKEAQLNALNAYRKTRGIPFSKMQETKVYKDFVKVVSIYGRFRMT